MTENNSLKIEQKWLIFGVVALTIIMATLDSSIVNIALPIIRADFDVDITIVEWVVVSYMLTIISLLMVFGRAADIYGQKKIYILGIIVFTLGSTLCAFSRNITELIIFRAFQGCGAACSMANGNAIITNVFPASERGKALGMIGSSVAIGLTAGPVLGGVITTYFGWRYIFLLNIPLGIVTAILANIYLLESQKDAKASFDFGGAITLSVSLTALMLSLTKYREWGLEVTAAVAFFAVIMFIAFLVFEKRIPSPMIDLALFRNGKFSNASVAAFLNFTARFSIIFLLPFYLVDLRGMKPSTAGLILTPVPVLFAVMAPFVGSLSDRIGSRFLTTSGMMMTASGFLLFTFIGFNSSVIYILFCMIITGIGGGLFSSPNISTIMGSVPKSRLGNAGAMNALVRNVGMVVGITWSAVIFSSIRNGEMDFHNTIYRIIPAYKTAMIISALIAIVAALISYKREEITIHYKQKQNHTA